jgi:hypothetical protein
MRTKRVLRAILTAGLLGLGAIAVTWTTAGAATDCCQGRVGNVNGTGGDEPTIGDVSMLIDFKFIRDDWVGLINCLTEADINQSGGSNPTANDITIGDISALIDYLFITGPARGLHECLGQSSNPFGYLHNMSTCKTSFAPADGGTSCIQYAYDGAGILSLIHTDAGLNCCPQLTLTVSVVGDTIFVTEVDSGLCDCLCLYDLEYRVENLSAGTYRIVVSEAVSSNGDPLDFWVDLAKSPTGTKCEDRLQYPWGSVPVGSVTGHSGCLSHAVGAAAASLNPDQTCVDLNYDGAGTLTFTHGNAGFNCCPGTISAKFAFDGSTITVTETEAYGEYGPCLCLCLFDVDFQITNLPPGTYRLVFVEPYLEAPDPALDFTVNLTQAGETMHCLPRSQYPWGIWTGVEPGK